VNVILIYKPVFIQHKELCQKSCICQMGRSYFKTFKR